MNAIATGTGLNSARLDRLPNASPSTAAGMNATARLTRRIAARRVRDESARARPETWRGIPRPPRASRRSGSTISKILPFSSLKSSRSAARIRWPVLETGRNSVRPSTTPSTRALRSTRRPCGRHSTGRGSARAATLPDDLARLVQAGKLDRCAPEHAALPDRRRKRSKPLQIAPIDVRHRSETHSAVRPGCHAEPAYGRDLDGLSGDARPRARRTG